MPFQISFVYYFEALSTEHVDWQHSSLARPEDEMRHYLEGSLLQTSPYGFPEARCMRLSRGGQRVKRSRQQCKDRKLVLLAEASEPPDVDQGSKDNAIADRIRRAKEYR